MHGESTICKLGVTSYCLKGLYKFYEFVRYTLYKAL